MSESLFSPSWYRVADLVPRMRSHARIHRIHFRGERWYLLQDRVSGKFHRFSPAAYTVLGLMDGKRRLADIWRIAGDRLGDNLPSQDETVRLLAQLYRANAIVTEGAPDIAELVERANKTRRQERFQNVRSPFAIRIPLADPDRWFGREWPGAGLLFSPLSLVLWTLVLATALVLVGQNWAPLTEGLTDRVLATENLVLLWIGFPVVKVLHEFGHAYAVKRWGGEVHEMGIMLLVGIPVPYVDASAATAFASRWQRALVGAAGVFVELFVAALATFVWVSVEPGILRAFAFNVMLIASVSSVVFNGNPFLRFDAYYVLSDLLELPNLGSRGNQYLGYLVQRYLFGAVGATSPVSTSGRGRGLEGFWLASYALVSFVVRMFVTLSIALFVASQLFVVGALLAAWSIGQFAVLPIFRHVRFLSTDPRLRGLRWRAWWLTGSALALITLGIAFLPVPSATLAEGVVWAPDGSRVVTGTDGEIGRLIATPGARVVAGEPLVELVDPDVVFDLTAAEASLEALQAEYALELTHGRMSAQVAKQAVEHAAARLERERARQQDLLVRSPADGVFLAEPITERTGQFVRRGTRLGYVTELTPIRVRVAVEPEAIDAVRLHNRSVDLRFAERMETVYPAVILSEVPGATTELPSMALSVDGGGRFALDPSKSKQGESLRRFFLLDLEATDAPAPSGVGGRVHVRFRHEPEPLGVQWGRTIRRIFLSRLDV